MRVVNVVCMKWGDLYGPEYVNILYAMVQRQLGLPFRFICFTDQPKGLNGLIEVQPLPAFKEPSEPYQRICQAWRKLALFRTDLASMRGKVLFLDLDVVLLNCIDTLFSHSDKFSMLENWYQPGKHIGQASVFCFEAGRWQYLLDEYEKNPDGIAAKYKTEQAYIAQRLGIENCHFFPEDWCLSYKKHVMPSGLPKFWVQEYTRPIGAKILVFHGRPNPPDAIAGRWGRGFSWYKRWNKPIKPCVWLANDWRE